MTAKRVNYWIVNWLQMIGLSVGFALVFGLLQMGGNVGLSDAWKEVMLVQISVFPYYLFVASAFVIMMIGMGFFQAYFSTLVSMNATRKEVAYGILGTVAAAVFAIVLMAAVIWKLVPGDISADGSSLLILFAGILFFTAAICLLVGFVVVKWGTIGGIIFFVFCVLIGGGAGFCAASGVMGDLKELVINLLTKFDLWWTLVIGVGAYVLIGWFIIMNTRKLEVRV